MIARILLTLLLLALPVAPAAPAAPQNPAAAQNPPAAVQSAPDLSSPEATIRSFALAVNALDVNGANCLVGGKIDQDLRNWAQAAKKSESFQITVVSVQPQVSGDSATAVVGLDVKAHGQQQHFDETLSLRKAGAEWKIVPPTDAELESYFKSGAKDPHILAVVAATYTHPRIFLNAREAAREAACRSNLKQLATAALMFLQDSDEKFALKADAYKAALKPYVRNESVFHCPSDEAGAVAYSFNAQLQGKRMAAIRNPAQTVMLYEGKQGALSFRHNGRAIVALASARVIVVTPAEARSLRWTP
jgi:hypothetical protein